MTLTPEHAQRAIENNPDLIPPVTRLYFEAIINNKLPDYYLSRFKDIKHNLSRTSTSPSVFSLVSILLENSFDDKIISRLPIGERVLNKVDYENPNKLIKKLDYIISHIKNTYKIE